MKKSLYYSGILIMIVVFTGIFYFSIEKDEVYAATGKFDFPTSVPTTVPTTVPTIPPSETKKVFLMGAREDDNYDFKQYMIDYGLNLNEGGNGVSPGGINWLEKQFDSEEPRVSEWKAFAEKAKSWPQGGSIVGQKGVKGVVYIVDEDGQIVGQLPKPQSFILYDLNPSYPRTSPAQYYYECGLPGMTNLGDPWNYTRPEGANRLWIGPGTITYEGQTYDVVGYASVSPIIIDLDGNGKADVDKNDWLPHPDRFNIDRAKNFDITGTGQPNLVEWLGTNDGLLVAPIEEVKVTGGRELFGTAVGFVDGYQKLSILRDKDKDGYVKGKELEGLKVWVDKNQDAICTSDELKTVQETGITSFDCTHKSFASRCIRDGKECNTWDWWPTMMILRPAASR